MNKFILVLGLVFVVAQYAGAQQSFGGGGHMGISISAFPKELKDYYGMGFGFGAHSDYNIIKYLSVRFDVDYYMFGFDDKKMVDLIAQNNGVAASTLTFSGRNVNIFAFTLNGLGKVPTKTMVTPYGIVGLGLHITSASDAKVTYNGQDVTEQLRFEKNVGETSFGLNFGAGAEFKFGQFKAFFEFKYVLIFTKGESTGHMPIMIGFGI